MKIVLVGEEAAGIQVLRALGQRDDEVVAVMARPDNRGAVGASLWEVAEANGHRVWPAEEVRHPALARQLRRYAVDAVLNVHSLYVVHPANLEVPRFGWFNLHPGPLPEYAGLNTVGWALHHGERAYGVTVHRMVARVDAGAICYQDRFPITDADTALSLSAKCVHAGVRLVMDLVETLGRDPAAVPWIKQDPSALRLFHRDELPDGGVFSWSRPAEAVHDFIRAFDYYPLTSPWGYPRSVLAGQEMGVIGATRTHRSSDAVPGTIEPSRGGAILVACSDEWLRIRRLHDAGHVRDASSILDGADVAIPMEDA